MDDSSQNTNKKSNKDHNSNQRRRRHQHQHQRPRPPPSSSSIISSSNNNNNNDAATIIQTQSSQQQQQQQQPRRNHDKNSPKRMDYTNNNNNTNNNRKILVLHGNQQTGQLLLGRMDKLRKKLSLYNNNNNNNNNSDNNKNNKCQIDLIAPDAPFACTNNSSNNKSDDDDSSNNNNDNIKLTWWDRIEDDYIGLEDSIEQLNQLWLDGTANNSNNNNNNSNNNNNNSSSGHNPFVGIIGFSQGAKLAHLVCICHEHTHGMMFPGMQFVILVAAYDAPILPPQLYNVLAKYTSSTGRTQSTVQSISNQQQYITSIPSLHVWGEQDRLIEPYQSAALMERFAVHQSLIHDGGHYVPMKAFHVQAYLDFIQKHSSSNNNNNIQPPPSESKNNYNSIEASNNINPIVGNDNSTATNTMMSTPATTALTQPPPPPPPTAAAAIPTTAPGTFPKENTVRSPSVIIRIPDEENLQAQMDEIEALEAMFPDEFQLLSYRSNNDDGDKLLYDHPIRYQIDLQSSSSDVDVDDEKKKWPPHPVAIQIEYPCDYPSSSDDRTNNTSSLPIITLITGKNNGMEFTSTQADACRQCMIHAAQEEQGMPCVLSIIYSAQEFFQSGRFRSIATITTQQQQRQQKHYDSDDDQRIEKDDTPTTIMNATESRHVLLKSSKPERISKCNLEGLQIAECILKQSKGLVTDDSSNINSSDSSSSTTSTGNSNGGSWMFTIGLVGKPSAGKSTFFNTATAFARQRNSRNTDNNNNSSDDGDDPDKRMAQLQLGGATMAPHPFTTIDPNIGYCLVPSPVGSCPDDNHYYNNNQQSRDNDKNDDDDNTLHLGNTHGRDSNGRRLLPVLLKDVAGLVPGAYQGRGRGNQFLNDLCDADVLIHVVDSSGMADTEGNIVGVVYDEQNGEYEEGNGNHGSKITSKVASLINVIHNTRDETNDCAEGSHPLNDMAWIRNELIEWVFTNLMHKWEIIRRKGRSKLSDMFTGYGQPQATTWNVLNSVEKFMEQHDSYRDRALDHLTEWDEGDVHRLVSAFLGVRFPIALGLNKCDLPTSRKYIEDILSAIPVHGTHAGTALSARSEMLFMKHHIERTLGIAKELLNDNSQGNIPTGTWQCLQSALSLREPVVVFPVTDFTTYSPMPGLSKYMTNDASLPSSGMIACLQAAGGCAPTLWDGKQYTAAKPKVASSNEKSAAGVGGGGCALRDAVMMKPGSTVEDVFLALKRMGALGGEFVRAEGSGDIGVPPKPVSKYQHVTKKIRILKIMTNKRTSWQKH